ncbi:MAG: L-histidine N(alpha)-methyltransferase [Marinoscillum sp.]
MQETQFARDIKSGLTASPKHLSSKYFYDAVGDKIFQKIMKLPEYYLTRAELEIFETKKEKLLEIIDPGTPFRIVELGAGDGMKTKVLLKYFQQQKANFSYSPVDISANVLKDLERNVMQEIPDLDMKPLAGDYFHVLSDLKFQNHKKNIAFFLGSNIGNFRNEMAERFLKSIQNNLSKGDFLMIGFDLKKDPRIILSAYNDAEGVTKSFNLNLLKRINREFDADFETENFDHNPIYDPMTGECRSYLISKEAMEVNIKKLDLQVRFKVWEPIFMEVSKKYDLEEINILAQNCGFRVVENLFDADKMFTDSIWEVI